MSKELEGLEPTRTNGEGAREFQEEVEALINNDVSQCVEANVPQLAESVSTIFEAKIKDIVLRRFHEWRKGKLDTIDQMSEAIEQDCSGQSSAADWRAMAHAAPPSATGPSTR